MSVCNAIIILFWSVTADPNLTSRWHPQVKLIDRGPAGAPPALDGFEVWTQDLFNNIIAEVFLFPFILKWACGLNGINVEVLQ